MIQDKAELGRRIKKIRESKRLTLKTMESNAGISATHISEIERGKTSPTMGALLRISGALGKDPAYFIEEEDLNDVSHVSVENRVAQRINGRDGGTIERLTTSIPGGRLQAYLVSLAGAQAVRGEGHTHDGNEAAMVLTGRVRFQVGDEAVVLEEGDAIQYRGDEPHRYENASKSESAAMIWVSSNRDES